MHRITANEAALIQRHLIAAALRVAKQERGIARLQRLAERDPELRPLVRTLVDLSAHAEPMMACDVVGVAA